jgi:hypothetical protein
MGLEGVVRSFCNQFATADDAVVHYLVGVVEDIEAGNAEVEDIEEIVCGFFPAFVALSEEKRHERLWQLLEQV